MFLPTFACSKLADMEDGEDQVEAATKVAEDYVNYILERDSEKAKALTQEKRGRDNDAMGDIFENMPYEQSNIVNRFFANTDFKIKDMTVSQEDGSAHGILVLTVPDLPKLLEADQQYSQVSFLNAIDDAPRTEKRISMDLIYVDEIYSVSTSTVEAIAKYVLSIGYGEDYTFSVLNDISAMECLRQFIRYSQDGKAEEIIAMTEGGIIWPNDYICNKYTNRFRQTYYSMIDCEFVITERHPDEYIVIKCTGLMPDMKTAGERFMEEENLVRFYGGFVYDSYYDKVNSEDSMETQLLYTIFEDLIQELPMVEVCYEVVVGVADDRVVLYAIEGLEPEPYKCIALSSIDDETHIELMFKGTDYLYEERIITDAYRDYWYKLIEEYRDSLLEE